MQSNVMLAFNMYKVIDLFVYLNYILLLMFNEYAMKWIFIRANTKQIRSVARTAHRLSLLRRAALSVTRKLLMGTSNSSSCVIPAA